MTTYTDVRVNVDWLCRKHMGGVLTIEQASFPYPWSLDDFYAALSQRHTLAKAVEVEGVTAAYVVYRLFPRAIHVLNLAVTPAYRRCGLATEIVERLQASCNEHRRRRVVVEIGERNVAGQLFFRKCGFECVKVVPSPWRPEDSDEDAYLLTWSVR